MVNLIGDRIRVVSGDITTVDCEAIVTAANSALMGGGGVDGAVHDAAGPKLVRASLALAPCSAGNARITEGFNLSARFVIHAVGPIFRDLETDTDTLARAYQSSLSLAAENNVNSIAFPCISTGAYRFPPDAACDIATDTVVNWLQTNDAPQIVVFCCFAPADHARYKKRLAELGITG